MSRVIVLTTVPDQKEIKLNSDLVLTSDITAPQGSQIVESPKVKDGNPAQTAPGKGSVLPVASLPINRSVVR